MSELLTYGDIRLLDVRGEVPCTADVSGATHLRAVLPATAETEMEMHKQGFMLADRTLGVAINLARPAIDFGKLVRMEIVESGEYRDDILRIANEGFPDDRRFHILPRPDKAVAAAVLAGWVKDLGECLVCLYKGAPVGFLALKKASPEARFVHLAAVEEKYRAAGAALSLYAKAACLSKERGYKRLEGRISARNTAVMNLYAFLGGSFSAPEDIFLKEVNAR